MAAYGERRGRIEGLKRLRSGLALLVPMIFGACSVLDPKPDGSRYFMLRPLAESGPEAAIGDLVLGLGPVTMPDYMDRIEMLDLVGPYELRFSPRNRWVEPLGGQVRAVLADNLRVLLNPDAVVEHPWFATDGVDVQVEVAFDALRIDEDGVWRGSAEWVLRGASPAPALERHEFIYELGRDSIPPDRLARELSLELGRLSGEIADGVRRVRR